MLIKVSECEPLYYAYDVSKRLTIFYHITHCSHCYCSHCSHCNQLYKPGFNKLTPTPDTSVSKVNQSYY